MSERLAITMGDPTGIGPEIVLKNLSLVSGCGREHVVIGDRGLLKEMADKEGVDLSVQVEHHSAQESEGGLRYVRLAHEMAMDGAVGGIVTGPIRKVPAVTAGQEVWGHTELLSQWSSVFPSATLMMVAPQMRVSLVTNHVPVSQVSSVLTSEAIFLAIERTGVALQSYLGIPHPKIAVLGLNPHAGEGGSLGTEEKEIIEPAIAAASKKGWAVEGPLPADSAFHFLAEGRWDVAVAMYHDQGLIPVKLGAFGEAVNVSLGLPYVRTSVDHGVAGDLVGQGVADPGSLAAAIRLAEQMVEVRGFMEKQARL